MTATTQRPATRAVDVVVIDPQEICRRAAHALGDGETIRVVGVAANVAGIALSDPDVVLLAADAADAGAVAAVKQRFPRARLVLLADASDGEAAFKGVCAGARGLIPTTAAPDEIRVAITAVARGELILDPAVSADALLWAARHDGQPEPRAETPLTPREREILSHLSEGLRASDIAILLRLSKRTVETHLANAYRKLGVHGRIDALRAYRAPRPTALSAGR